MSFVVIVVRIYPLLLLERKSRSIHISPWFPPLLFLGVLSKKTRHLAPSLDDGSKVWLKRLLVRRHSSLWPWLLGRQCELDHGIPLWL